MDPLDHLLALPDGLRCTVCDERVPATRIRLLARRDDLAFLQIDCPSCASATLGFVHGGRTDGPAPLDDPPLDERPPIDADDVLDMHQLLATWRGDLTGLLASDDRGRAESSR
jgi:phage FluMu protein Com